MGRVASGARHRPRRPLSALRADRPADLGVVATHLSRRDGWAPSALYQAAERERGDGVRSKRSRGADAWEGVAELVPRACPDRLGERKTVVGFVQTVRRDDLGWTAEVLVAGEAVLVRFPRALVQPEPWTWTALEVECRRAPDRDLHLPGEAVVLVEHLRCPAEAPEWSVRRALHQRGSAARRWASSSIGIGFENR